jgi:hypothetical protein
MASNPKLEFYKFKLNPKDSKSRTFRNFAIEELGADEKVSNDNAFKECFTHFIQTIETKHAKSEKKKKTITIIANAATNPYLSLKPSPIITKKIIAGVINGGPYDKDAIVSDIADKEDNSKLGRNKSVLLPYFVFVYLPPDHNEGFFAIHSNNSDETVTTIFRSYIANLFAGNNYYKAILEAFCPESFQDEFKDGAIIKNVAFSTTVVDNTLSKDPIKSLLKEYTIRIEATPKSKDISIGEASKVINFFRSKIFKTKKIKKLNSRIFLNRSLQLKTTQPRKQKCLNLIKEIMSLSQLCF